MIKEFNNIHDINRFIKENTIREYKLIPLVVYISKKNNRNNNIYSYLLDYHDSSNDVNKITKTYLLPEDKEKFDLENKASELWFAIKDFKERLHRFIKQKETPDIELDTETLNYINTELIETLNTYNITLEELS